MTSEETQNRKYVDFLIPGVLLLYMLISPGKDIITWLTLVVGPILVISLIIAKERGKDIPYARYIFMLGGVLPILGMFFGRFEALFTLPIPFGYYILVALIVVLHFWTAIQLSLMNKD